MARVCGSFLASTILHQQEQEEKIWRADPNTPIRFRTMERGIINCRDASVGTYDRRKSC